MTAPDKIRRGIGLCLCLGVGLASLFLACRDPEFGRADRAAAALVALEQLLTQENAAGTSFRVLRATRAKLVRGALGTRRAVVPVASWDGRGWRICSAACAATGGLFIPDFVEGPTPGGRTLHSASVLVRERGSEGEGEEGVFFFETDPAGAVADAWIVPAEEDTNADVMFSRDQFRLTAGLAVAFYVREIEAATGYDRNVATPFLDLVDEPTFSRDVIPANREGSRRGRLGHRILARDLGSRVGVSPDLARR